MPAPHRRTIAGIVAAAASVALLAACTAGAGDTASTAPATSTPEGEDSATTDDAIQSLLDDAAATQFDERALGSLVAEIRVDGDVVAQTALGEALQGEPVTLDGRFRNGAVAITYVSTVMLRLAEEGVIDLDHPIEKWLPDLLESDQVTPRMLANMTAGYPDHVKNEDFVDAVVADPFRVFTNDDLLAYSSATPRAVRHRLIWDDSHSDYVILGEVMEAATGKSLEELIAEYVLDPLDLEGTVADQTPAIPAPVVHAFTAERGVWEDSTYLRPVVDPARGCRGSMRARSATSP